MSRLDAMFERLKRDGDGAFGAFLMLGDPDLETSARLLDAAARGGADMLEVGIPFSDPVADGPVIQRAAIRAIRAGVRVDDCFDLIADFRRIHPDIPLGILTYANLLVARGADGFCARAQAAGADSLLVADIPSIEAAPYANVATKAGLDWVMIAAPNTPDPTLARIAGLARGYTYCVARAGVTGTGETLQLNHRDLFDRLCANRAPPPVLGFGISIPDHVAEAIRSGAAGAISGSAIVRLIEESETPVDAVEAFVAAMKAATRTAA